MGVKGVFITWICFPDALIQQKNLSMRSSSIKVSDYMVYLNKELKILSVE